MARRLEPAQTLCHSIAAESNGPEPSEADRQLNDQHLDHVLTDTDSSMTIDLCWVLRTRPLTGIEVHGFPAWKRSNARKVCK